MPKVDLARMVRSKITLPSPGFPSEEMQVAMAAVLIEHGLVEPGNARRLVSEQLTRARQAHEKPLRKQAEELERGSGE